MPHNINSRKIQGGTFNDVGRDQTNNTYRGRVVGHHVQIETMTVGCSHSQQSVKRTMYDEFEYIKLGQIIPLETLSTEDLSQLELSYRSGRMVGRLKTRVTTCTVTIGHDKDSKLVAMMYEGEDAQKAWEHDFQYISGIKEPGYAHLTPSHLPFPPHILTLPPDTEHTPVTSMQVKDLDGLLRRLSWMFYDLVKKRPYLQYDTVNFNFGWFPWLVNDGHLPDGMQGLVTQLYLSQTRLQYGSSPKEWDQVLQQVLHLLHVWGCEIDSEAGKKDKWKWVRVKDSGSIHELHDNEDRPDMHSWATYSSEEDEDWLSFGADSYTSEDEGTHPAHTHLRSVKLIMKCLGNEGDWLSSYVDSYIPEDDTEDDEVILYPRSN
ncbi:hypothetical protein VNI00_016862 [Paramarasmius palmivorus]|uniref:Uncharacterized protein n=1 Tax=Paramarasmius palmivorus TaxID=297713 RepID=A0AAW0B9H5_9AGAR